LKNMKRVLTTMVVIATLFTFSCKKEKKPPTAPSVTTAALTNISTTGATAGGTITGDGNSPVTASGVVLSRTHVTPTLTDTVLSTTTTTGSFTVNISNLEFGRTYYIRAYATNAIGTTYGDVVTLNTTNDDTKVRFTYMGQEVIYGVITSSKTGKKWMDRNLGSSAVATSLTDTAGYGHLFNWGRGADGHQLRTSGKTSALSSTDNPGHSNFIYNDASVVVTGDWRDPQNNSLWQGSTGINNPCPSGWHVPTKAEWDAENITNGNIAFNQLKLTLAGRRSQNSGNVIAGTVGINGCYWSSTVSTTDVWYLLFDTGTSLLSVGNRSVGSSVRCIKD
jgi:uncharacterized protein (TIGR02145 family)